VPQNKNAILPQPPSIGELAGNPMSSAEDHSGCTTSEVVLRVVYTAADLNAGATVGNGGNPGEGAHIQTVCNLHIRIRSTQASVVPHMSYPRFITNSAMPLITFREF